MMLLELADLRKERGAMSNNVTGKTVLITGTSTGIGRVTALHLDQLGYQVIGTVRKDSDAQNLRSAASTRLRALLLDVADPSSLDKFQESLAQELGNGGLWGLVNNAAIGFSSPLEFVALSQYRRLFEVNLFGLLAVTQICLPYLRQEHGRVINVSSTASIVIAPFHGPYSAAKSGLNALSNALRLELRPFGVQVSVLICGSVQTPIWVKGGTLASNLWAEQPPEATQLYGRQYAQLGSYFRQLGHTGIPPEAVAEVIEQALSSKRARQTYFIGSDAHWFRLFSKLFPERLRDWLILRIIGLET